MAIFSQFLWILLLPALVSAFAQTFDPEVQELQGISDYRSVILTWKTSPSSMATAPVAFLVRVCPLNSPRGAARQLHLPCIERLINETETQALPTGTATGQRYSAVIDGLRLATAYRFQVTALHDVQSGQEKAFLSHQTLDNNPGEVKGVLLTTRGFAARVVRCQRDFTEVEVDTGPYFGGRLAVEGATDERCHVLGDSKSPRTKYILVVAHRLCHTQKTAQSLETVVVASASPSILTRSSRRFLVACDLLPDSLTVHATVNVSTNSDSLPSRESLWLDAARPLQPTMERDPVPGMHLADQNNGIAERRMDDGMYGLPTNESGNGVSVQVAIVVAVGTVAGAIACVALALYARSIRHRRGQAASSTPTINNLHPEPTAASSTQPSSSQASNVALTSHRTLSYI